MRFSGILLVALLSSSIHLSAQHEVFLDADTANEVDDIYAITRAFAHTDWHIKTLAAAQWQSSQWATDHTMEDSYRFNQTILGWLPNPNVESVRGGHRRLYDWGNQAIYSHAALKLIERAHAQPAGKRLTVIALGALTNVASALLIDSSIQDKIDLYWLGSTYDFDQDHQGHTDFNALMDPQAMRIIFESKLKVHVLPVSEVGHMVTRFAEAKKILSQTGELGGLLLTTWRNHQDGGRHGRVLWDMALIELMIHPELAEQVKVESLKNPNVTYYRNVEVDQVQRQALKTIASYLKGLQHN